MMTGNRVWRRLNSAIEMVTETWSSVRHVSLVGMNSSKSDNSSGVTGPCFSSNISKDETRERLMLALKKVWHICKDVLRDMGKLKLDKHNRFSYIALTCLTQTCYTHHRIILLQMDVCLYSGVSPILTNQCTSQFRSWVNHAGCHQLISHSFYSRTTTLENS